MVGLYFWTLCPKVERRKHEIFDTQAVCSTVKRAAVKMKEGGTDAGGSNAENNRSCH